MSGTIRSQGHRAGRSAIIIAVATAMLLCASAEDGKVDFYSYLPQTNIVADGQTIYELQLRIDTTGVPDEKFSSWRWTPKITSPMIDQGAKWPSDKNPSDNEEDFFYDWKTDDSWNRGPYWNDINTKGVEGQGGPSNRDFSQGLLGTYFFTVPKDAKIGDTGTFVISSIFGYTPDGRDYSRGKRNLNVISDTFTIMEDKRADFIGWNGPRDGVVDSLDEKVMRACLKQGEETPYDPFNLPEGCSCLLYERDDDGDGIPDRWIAQADFDEDGYFTKLDNREFRKSYRGNLTIKDLIKSLKNARLKDP